MVPAERPTLDALSSAELARRLVELAGEERQAQVDFLLHLDAFDRRRAWLEAGYGSLWAYCMEALHLREGAAGRRIGAMRVLRRLPRLEAALRDGRICISTVTLLGPLLTDENADALVARAAFLSKAETERLVATLQPREAPREGIRMQPGPQPRAELALVSAASAGTAAPALTTVTGDTEGVQEEVQGSPLAAPPAAAQRHAQRHKLRPLDGASYSLTVTLRGEAKADLDALVDLLSHKTGRDLGAVVHEAIRCALEKHGKRRGAVAPSRCASPRSPEDGPPSAGVSSPVDLRTISASVKRQVWARDGGRCTYVSPDGRRCGSRWKLEFHHRDPAARGGPPTLANITLRCKPHNLLAAEQDFGAERIAPFTGREPTAREDVAMYAAGIRGSPRGRRGEARGRDRAGSPRFAGRRSTPRRRISGPSTRCG